MNVVRAVKLGFPLIALAVLCTLGVSKETAASDNAAPSLAVSSASTSAPAPVAGDVSNLVPAIVELATPQLCGAITVFDQEDVGTLCNPIALAATPITSPSCPQTVSGSVRLETDLLCFDTSGLIVGSDNTIIDLNGHEIVCVGVGYSGSCQNGQVTLNVVGDVGVDTNDRNNVHVFSHLPGGTIDGFDVGVFSRADSDNVKVKQLTITGPAGIPGNDRLFSIAIFVLGDHCNGGKVHLGGGTNTGNDLSNHLRGIHVQLATCIYAGYNTIHDIKDNTAGGTDFSVGIALVQATDNHVRGNIVTDNGDNGSFEGGLALQATSRNLLVDNQVNNNNGNGIETLGGATNSYINNNQMLYNTQVDAFTAPLVGDENRWNFNNRCQTQTTPEPPPGVCNPGEVPPPQ